MDQQETAAIRVEASAPGGSWPASSEIQEVISRSRLPCTERQKASFDASGFRNLVSLQLEWQIPPTDFLRLAETLVELWNLGLVISLVRREFRLGARGQPVAEVLDVESGGAQSLAGALEEAAREGVFAPLQKAGRGGPGALFLRFPFRRPGDHSDRKDLEELRANSFLRLLEKARSQP